MRLKREYAYTALGYMMLLVSAVLLINAQAQAPRQAQIVFQSYRDGNSEIYVMDADGKNQQNLTNNPGNDGFPAWSPDGQRIEFDSDRDGDSEIYVMGEDGENQQNLTDNPASDYAAAWSPDGRQIIFNSDRDGNMEIYVMDADGKNLRNLTNNPAGDQHPNWFDPAFAYAVEPSGKLGATWGWLKRNGE